MCMIIEYNTTYSNMYVCMLYKMHIFLHFIFSILHVNAIMYTYLLTKVINDKIYRSKNTQQLLLSMRIY